MVCTYIACEGEETEGKVNGRNDTGRSAKKAAWRGSM
jgi:hypothetical protein